MRFSLEQFSGVFKIRNADGQPFILIGGQAVNYWATRYLAVEPDLKAWQPFTSKDIDFQGTVADVRRAASLLGRPSRLPHKRMMTAFAGGVSWPVGDALSQVEFVRTLPGVKPSEVERFAVTHLFGEQTIRVADPVSLLACKLHLALTVDQTNRRDADHVRILVLCSRAFLRETLLGAADGALPVRGWLGAAERVLKLAESKLGRRAVRALELDWNRALPLVEIAASPLPPVVQFREKRLAQWRAKQLNRGKRKPVSD
ncbi:MAG: hypothetical protein ACK45B_02415 [Limisphaerales bacterium]